MKKLFVPNSAITAHIDSIIEIHNSFLKEMLEKLKNVLSGEKITLDIVDARTGNVLIPANRKMTTSLLRRLVSAYQYFDIDPGSVRNRIRQIIEDVKQKYIAINPNLFVND